MLFVTGLTGLVGRALQTIAVNEGVALRGLTRRVDDLEASSGRGTIEWVRGHLTDVERLTEAIRGASAVLHMAAQTGAASDAAFHESNVNGTEHLLEAAAQAGVQRFIFVSTIAVNFGNLEGYPYARSKKAAEAAVSASGLDWTIVRPTLVLGPAAPNLEKLAGLAGLPVVPQLGGGGVRLQPIDARDLAQMLLDVARQGPVGEILEVGGPEVLTMKAFLARIRTARGKGPAPSVPIPLFPVRWAAGLLGAVLGERAPIKAAQLSSFTEDAVAEAHAFVEERVGSFHPLSATLTESLAQ